MGHLDDRQENALAPYFAWMKQRKGGVFLEETAATSIEAPPASAVEAEVTVAMEDNDEPAVG